MPRISHLFLIVALLAPAISAAQTLGPRWQQHTAKAAKGTDKFKVSAATWFGGPGSEEFCAVGTMPNGDIIAFGNSWGPTFPEVPNLSVLGKGSWYEVSEYEHGQPTYLRKGKVTNSPLAYDYPNKAGFMVVYSSDLRQIKRVVRFDWGVAGIYHAAVLPDGDVIIAGRALQAFSDSVITQVKMRHAYAVPDAEDYGDLFDDIDDPKSLQKAIDKYQKTVRTQFGPVYYQGVKMPGDAYIMRLRNLTEPVWVTMLPGYQDMRTHLIPMVAQGDPPDAKPSYIGFSARGPKRVRMSDGQPDLAYGGGTLRGARAFNPYTGEYYLGGTKFSGTGREPYKNPWVHCYAANGKLQWKAYEWHSHMVGHDRFRLVSDSTFSTVMPDQEGYVWMVMSSDGGNSVATRHPFNILQSARINNPLGMLAWGAQLAHFTHLAKFNPETLDFAAYSFWATYLPSNGRPNSIGISRMYPLQDGSMAVIGKAATGLVQTPGAFVTFPDIAYDQEALGKLDDRLPMGYGGNYLTIFDKNLSSLRFSSYLPEMKAHDIANGPNGGVLLVSSASRIDDGREPEPWGRVPIVNAIQPEFGGGMMDAHILLLHDPKEN